MSREYVDKYLEETQEIVKRISREEIVKAAGMLRALRERRGRLFVLGVGGSAANASHAVNDFRKIGGDVCADGQRFGINGKDERRGMGNHVQRMAESIRDKQSGRGSGAVCRRRKRDDVPKYRECPKARRGTGRRHSFHCIQKRRLCRESVGCLHPDTGGG